MDANQQPRPPASGARPPVPPPVPVPEDTPEQRRTIRMQRRPGPDAKITFLGTAGPATESEVSSIDAVVHAFGSIFHNTIHQSWLSVADVNDTLDRAFAILQKSLAEHNEITFSIADGMLKVNKEPYALTTSSAKTFVEYLNSIEAHHFTIYSGMERLEFTRFIALLTSTVEELKEKGGFYEAINGEGFKCIRAVKVFIQEVTEEETVVSRREMEKKLEEQRLQAEMDVLAMLDGNEAADVERAAASAHIMAQDSGKMAGMIVEAAAKQHAAGNGQQTKSASLVTCLRRAFNGLMKDPSLETQKGKKALMKTLRELEKEIHVQMGDSPDEAEKSAITEAIETMEDELRMDAIAAEYTKRLKAIEQSEKRILRFIKAQGLDEVDDSELALKLSEAGLDVSGWHALLAKSKASAHDRDLTETEDGTLSAIGSLAALLSQLQSDVKTPETAGPEAKEKKKQQLADHMAQVDQEVKAIAAETEQKIQSLVKDISAAPESDAAGESETTVAHRLTRARLLKTLAEIVQELCQPLSVVTCSINVVTSNALGEVPKAQLDMLKLAEANTLRIERLMRALKDIAGMPNALHPDATLRNAINSP